LKQKPVISHTLFLTLYSPKSYLLFIILLLEKSIRRHIAKHFCRRQRCFWTIAKELYQTRLPGL